MANLDVLTACGSQLFLNTESDQISLEKRILLYVVCKETVCNTDFSIRFEEKKISDIFFSSNIKISVAYTFFGWGASF